MVTLSLLSLALMVGTIWEFMARSKAARAFPPPGRLVDIGGRLIHLDCRGTGAPVVVFEAGLDTLGSLSWAAVHDAVAQTTRACAYSRAGIMWSDGAGRPFSVAGAAEDLHRTLAAAGEKGPFVMVGHSLGGPYLLAYAGRYADEVAGLVFVDASHPDQVARMREAIGKDLSPSTAMISAAAAVAWTGLLRAAVPTGVPPHAPPSIAGPSGAYFPTSLRPVLQELEAIEATLAAAGAARKLGDRPLVVLTAGAKMSPEELKESELTAEQGDRLKAVWRNLQDEEATWSTRSRHETLPDASHYIQFDKPDVVIAAVREVVSRVR